LTNEELVLEYQNGNRAAMDELVENNMGLVKYFTNKYGGFANITLDIEDLEQEAWIGFMKAVEKYKFNEDEPVLFSSYASKAIMYGIFRAFDENSQRMKKSDRTTKVSVISFSTPISSADDSETMEYILPDKKAEEPFRNIEKEVDNEILRKDIFEMLDTVLGNDIDKRILIEHYGLYGEPMTFEDIGKKHCLSTQWVSQLEVSALRKIRHSTTGKAFMNKYYDDYVGILEERKESINQFNSPDLVISQMAGIDELLNNILKKYEA
jgi:RNA polymerase sigma factor (sigma-70 family)